MGFDKEGIREKGDREERGVLKVNDVEAEAASSIGVEHKVLIIEVAVAESKLPLEADSRISRACLSVGPSSNLQ
jgi:hypothetical protein